MNGTDEGWSKAWGYASCLVLGAAVFLLACVPQWSDAIFATCVAGLLIQVFLFLLRARPSTFRGTGLPLIMFLLAAHAGWSQWPLILELSRPGARTALDRLTAQVLEGGLREPYSLTCCLTIYDARVVDGIIFLGIEKDGGAHPALLIRDPIGNSSAFWQTSIDARWVFRIAD